ncbi:MAG: sirohydrochlorin chelatase [Nannocystaceae bacterium]
MGSGVGSGRFAVLMVGHGSACTSANRAFEALVAEVARRCDASALAFAYLGAAAPTLGTELARLLEQYRRVLVVPLLLFDAAHAGRDLPRALEAARSRSPGAEIELTPVLGEAPALIALAREQVMAVYPPGPATPELLVVGRGSSYPGAVDALRRVAEALGGAWPVEGPFVAFLAAALPTVEVALASALQQGVADLVVLPYLLFGGNLARDLRGRLERFGGQHPHPRLHLASHPGVHPDLPTVLAEHVCSNLRRCGWWAS